MREPGVVQVHVQGDVDLERLGDLPLVGEHAAGTLPNQSDLPGAPTVLAPSLATVPPQL